MELQTCFTRLHLSSVNIKTKVNNDFFLLNLKIRLKSVIETSLILSQLCAYLYFPSYQSLNINKNYNDDLFTLNVAHELTDSFSIIQ